MSRRVLSLALKITGEAKGLRLTAAERQLKALQTEADKVTKQFERFGDASSAAGQAQQAFAADLSNLTSALTDRQIGAKRFAEEFAGITAAAKETAAAFEEGARVSEKYRKDEELRAREIDRLNKLLKLGAIEQETYNRAVADVSGANAEAARAAKEQAEVIAEAARVTSRFEPEIDRFERTQAKLNQQVQSGLISQETYNRALESAASRLTDAERAAAGLAARVQESDNAAASTTLRFNELSGIFSVLPGPLGAIAGRISGITSASEGLGRVFSGGLSQGLSRVAESFVSLVSGINPATAAIAGFAAAATGIGTALDRLEGRVENLGNLATRLGVSFEFIQVLEDSAKRSGTSVDSVAFAFTRLQRTLAGTDEESKKVVRALGAVGLAVDDIAGKSPEEQYKVIGQALLQIEDPAKRSAAAIELFGRSGATLLPFFNNLPKAARDFERFGKGINELDKARIDDFGEAIDGLNRATTRLGEVALTPFAGLAEGITKVAAQFVNAITAVAEVVGKLLTPALDQIGAVVGVASGVIEGLAVLFRALSAVAEPFGKFILPAIVAQVAFLNREILVGAISTLGRSLAAAATAARTFSVANGIAAASTRGLALAIRGLLSSTGIGLLVVAAGFVVEKLLAWGDAAKDVGDASEEAGNTAKTAAEKAAEAYKKQEAAAREAAERRKKQLEEEARNVDKLIEKYRDFQSIENEFGGDRARFEASQRVEQIERQILIARRQYNQAVKDGANSEAVAAGRRLRLLQEVLVQEQDIASGRAKFLADQKKQTEELAEAERKRAQAEAENIQKAIDKFKEQQVIRQQFDGDRKRFEAAQRVADIEAEIARLAQARSQAILTDNESQLAALNERQKILGEMLLQEDAIASGRAAQVAEAEKLAERDRKRVADLLRPDDVTAKIKEDLQAVSREIVAAQGRLQNSTRQELRQAAREDLRELQTLQKDLNDRIRAAAQGFEQGFGKAFEATAARFNDLQRRAAEFGAAGEGAAERLLRGIEKAKELASRGIFDKEQFEQEVARQQQLFEKQLADIRALADERKRINDFVDQQVELARFNGDQQRLQAAKNVAALEAEIGRVQQEIQAARAAGDNQAVQAAVQRLAQLDQVAAKERDIASGRLKAEQDIAKQREESLKAEQQRRQQIQQEQKRAQEEQARAAAAEADRQAKRIRALNSIGQQSVGGGDIRTSQGASAFIQAASGAFDPNLAELRAQSKLLRQIVLNSGALQFLERGVGSTFQFLGGGA